MNKEKSIIVIDPKERNKEDIKEILLKIVEEKIRMYLSKNNFSGN